MNPRDLKILYIGPLAYGGTCIQRMWALQDLQYTVVGINTDVPVQSSNLLRFSHKVRKKFFLNNVIESINRKIIKSALSFHPNVVWVDKGLLVTSSTLRLIKLHFPKSIFVSFSPDDMMNPDNQTSSFLDCLPIYDYHVTTKSYNIDELKALGAKNVIMIDNSYCRRSHKPINLTDRERLIRGGRVGFIGYWEKERSDYLTFLAEQNVSVRVWGPWKRRAKYPPNLQVEGVVAWGDDYASTISAFDINLCFLRKVNRDLQTTRSIEIPACGGFMLAERSIEHLSLFQEGKEAVFFESKEELLEKVIYYSNHKDERQKIALAGYQRCINSGYSYSERLSRVMQILLKTNEHST